MLKITAIFAQFAVLAGMVAYYSVPYYSPTEIVVRGLPVDPRHPFMGDYVILGYDFSRIEGAKPDFWKMNMDEYCGRTVYTLFVPDEDAPRLWRVEKTTFAPPKSGVYIAGKLTRYGRIVYGIEQFYVQAGTGKELEKAMRSRNTEITLGVTAAGRAVVKDVKIIDN